MNNSLGLQKCWEALDGPLYFTLLSLIACILETYYCHYLYKINAKPFTINVYQWSPQIHAVPHFNVF